MATRLAVAARTDVGRVRQTNEDALLVADLAAGPRMPEQGVARFEVGERGALLAVSDGMGGHKGGEVASAMTLDSVHKELVERTSLVEAERVKSAVERANRDVLAAGTSPAYDKMGATLTAVLVQGVQAHIGQIGDSRAYLLRDGNIRQVTHDQSYVQVLLDAGALDAEEAKSSPMKNILLQALGQTPNIKVALGSLELRNRDCLLLCSDGLYNKLTLEELRDTVLGSPSLDVACERLVTMANERGGEDNITALLAGVGGDVPAAPAGERISDTFHVLTTFDPRAGK